MKCFSRSTDVFNTCGEQWTRTAKFWILVQSQRNKKAAKKFFHGAHSAAKSESLPSVEHRQDKWQNNCAENSHQPTRLRERVMRRFKSASQAQRFLSAYGIISSHFRVSRHLLQLVVTEQ